MSALQLVRTSLEDHNTVVIRLVGRNRIEDSLSNAEKLCARMHREARTGLITDYRQCQLDHTVTQFTEVAKVFCKHMPKAVRIAYVYGSDNMLHAATMTKMLKKCGFEARAFASFDDAVAFIAQNA